VPQRNLARRVVGGARGFLKALAPEHLTLEIE
jgi:hypothetical protein